MFSKKRIAILIGAFAFGGALVYFGVRKKIFPWASLAKIPGISRIMPAGMKQGIQEKDMQDASGQTAADPGQPVAQQWHQDNLRSLNEIQKTLKSIEDINRMNQLNQQQQKQQQQQQQIKK